MLSVYMHTIILGTFILATFITYSRTVVSMCGAGIVLIIVALWTAKTDIAQARGLDKIVALGNLCFRAPLSIFGPLHRAEEWSLVVMVPSFMPWPLFWAYFFGFALRAVAL